MAVFTKLLLSGSTNGKLIRVTGTTTGAAVTLHTAHATDMDEVYLEATNDSINDVILTIEFGGTTATDLILVKIKKGEKGMIRVVAGLPLTGGLLVKAFAAVANVINIGGWVNRIT